MMNLKVALVISVIGSLFAVSALSVEECNNANEGLQSGNLGSASELMWSKYDKTCEASGFCSSQVEVDSPTTIIDYSALKETDEWTAVRKACHDLRTNDFRTTLCRVTSKLVLPVGDEANYYIKKEPVCFSDLCHEGEVHSVDPKPFGCDPDKFGCEVKSITAKCEDRDYQEFGLGKCTQSQYKINTNMDYKNARLALDKKVTQACGQFDHENPACIEPSNTDTPIWRFILTQNFRQYQEDEVYQKYEKACYKEGGQTCYLSSVIRMNGNFDRFTLDVTADFNLVPGCFPATCEIPDRESILKDHLIDVMSDRVGDLLHGSRRLIEDENELSQGESHRMIEENIIKCALGMDGCDMTVNDFYCTGRDGIEIDTPSSSSYQRFEPGFYIIFVLVAANFVM